MFITLSYGLVLVVGQWKDKETNFGHRAPVMKDSDFPDSGSQWLVKWRTVVSELCTCVDQDVVGSSNNIGGVDPDHGDCDVWPFVPFLHAYCLIHGTHQASDVPEHTLFSVPLCANLRETKIKIRGMYCTYRVI